MLSSNCCVFISRLPLDAVRLKMGSPGGRKVQERSVVTLSGRASCTLRARWFRLGVLAGKSFEARWPQWRAGARGLPTADLSTQVSTPSPGVRIQDAPTSRRCRSRTTSGRSNAAAEGASRRLACFRLVDSRMGPRGRQVREPGEQNHVRLVVHVGLEPPNPGRAGRRRWSPRS
jgi:hypothetical protein